MAAETLVRRTPAPVAPVKTATLARSVFIAALAVGVLVWAAAAKLSELLLPFGTDQGLFSLIGNAILQGAIPYRDIWDNKPPGLYYTYAAVLALFPPHPSECAAGILPSVAGHVRLSCGHVGVMALDLTWTIGIALALFSVGRVLLISTWLGATAAALFLLFGVQSPVSHGGAKPELLLLLPECLAYLLLGRFLSDRRRVWLVLSGLCVGGAILFKQTAAVAGLSIVALLILSEPRRTWSWKAVADRVITWVAGVLAVIIPIGLYFWWAGALGDALFASVGFNLDYVRSPDESVLERLVLGSGHVFRGSQALLWTLALVGAVRLLPLARQRGWARLLVFWAVGDAVAVSLGGGRFYSYYFLQVVPSFSLLASHALLELWRWTGRSRDAAAPESRSRRAWLLLSCAAIFSLSVWLHVPVLLRALHERALHWVPSEAERAAAAIRLLPAGRLLVWGDSNQVYVLTGREPATRYVHGVGVSERWARAGGIEQRREELLNGLAEQRPLVVAIDPWSRQQDPDGVFLLNLSSFPELTQFLERSGSRPELDTGAFRIYIVP